MHMSSSLFDINNKPIFNIRLHTLHLSFQYNSATTPFDSFKRFCYTFIMCRFFFRFRKFGAHTNWKINFLSTLIRNILVKISILNEIIIKLILNKWKYRLGTANCIIDISFSCHFVQHEAFKCQLLFAPNCCFAHRILLSVVFVDWKSSSWN